MQKKFVTSLALLLFLNLLIKPFWALGIEVEVQNTVNTKNFGEYFALFNFSFLLNIILDFGITNFNNRNIAQNNHLLTKHFSSIFVLKLILAALYIITTLSIGLIIGYDFRYMKLLMVLGFNQILISMVLYLRSNLLGLHMFKTDSIISILDRSIMIILCAAILWSHAFGIEMDIMWFAYIQTLAYFVTALFAFVLVVRKTDSLSLKFSLPFSLMILKKSFPFAILTLLMTFYNRLDAVMLERLMPENGAHEAGIYAKSFRLLDSVNMIAYLFSVILLPTFSRMIKYRESIEQLVKLSFCMLITPAIIIAGGCYFYRIEIISLLYGNDHLAASANVFTVLMGCFMAISTTYIFGTLLTANGNLRELNLMACAGVAVNILLNFIFIPKYHALGSAYISLLTQFITAFIQLLIARHMFRFRTNTRLLITLFIFTAGVLIINYLSVTTLPFRWELNFIIMTTSCIVLAFSTGLLSIKGMFRILKYG